MKLNQTFRYQEGHGSPHKFPYWFENIWLVLINKLCLTVLYHNIASYFIRPHIIIAETHNNK